MRITNVPKLPKQFFTFSLSFITVYTLEDHESQVILMNYALV